MECPERGELWDYAKHFGVISSSMFRYFACQIIKAVSIIHSKY
jgi:hypothetical protein